MKPGTEVSSDVTFYSMLHWDASNGTSPNLSAKHSSALKVYLKNGLQLGHSIRSQAKSFVLLTNSQAVRASAITLGLQVEVYESRKLPPNVTRFRNAHHKVDALHHLASKANGIHILLDLDVAVVSSIEVRILDSEFVCLKLPYSGNDLKMYFGDEFISDTWFGGELIGGSSFALAKLVSEIELHMESYLERIEQFDHQGDEAFLNLAIQGNRELEGRMVDSGLVRRFWSIPTSKPMKPLFPISTTPFLHLPADKRFLAVLSNLRLNSAQVRFVLAVYLSVKSIFSRVLVVFRRNQHSPKLFLK